MKPNSSLLLGALAMTTLGCAQILGVEPDPTLVSPQCSGTLGVRITTDDSGPAKEVAPSYTRGLRDYLRNLNDTQGGLRGCPIDIDVKDASYDPKITQMTIDA